jgi:protein involved in polysaccharide export with SLBB domain
LGEVYKPGSYLVSSLSSLVNVLSLTGGPTAVGSYRSIRVMRGGKRAADLDLYPLRAEGLGNPNVPLQNGDVIFVPLAGPTVMLEGGFVRMIPQDPDTNPKEEAKTEKKIENAVGDSKQNLDTTTVDDKLTKAGLAQKNAQAARDILPLMQFELRDGETALDAVHFAGGLLPSTFPDALSLRRQDQEGLTTLQDIPFAELGKTGLQRGDVLSAFPRRDRLTRMVSVVGWARVPGSFGRPEGLRVGDLLKRDHQVLPDTYLQRGEITRTLEDGTTRYLAFQVSKAMAGDPAHNLLLEDRDRIELFQVTRMRLPLKVSISGPITQPGKFEFNSGMRAADLIFKGGILDKNADRFYAELAHRKDGKVSEVIRLDLAKLASTETSSPVRLTDDAINPPLRDDDQITVYAKPGFKIHRTVKVLGEVARPGAYVLETERPTLSQLVARAGGITPLAMPKAGILLRRMGSEGLDVEKEQANGSIGVSDVLARLNETKMYVDPSSLLAAAGQMPVPKLFTPPLLHGLDVTRDNRLVVDFEQALKQNPDYDLELNDGDTVIIPRRTDSVMVLGEAATPFAYFKVVPGMTVSDLLKRAGGTTRNADTSNIRLMRANGMILDSWVSRIKVEPGDALLIPQRIRRDTNWQENLQALTPLALILNAVK